MHCEVSNARTAPDLTCRTCLPAACLLAAVCGGVQVCEFFMEQCTAASGIHMHMSSSPTAIIKESDGTLTVKLEPVSKDSKDQGSTGASTGAGAAGGGASEIRGNDTVVLAVGRAGKTKGLGLEEVGVEMGPKGSVKVDEFSRTNIPNIWACGDVTSRIALTPVAIMEGQAIGDSIGMGNLVAPAYDAVPSACFSYPFVATVVSLVPGPRGRSVELKVRL